jgi:microsomal dipeptidase-like Zn-dependent dipeptidase
VDFKRYVTELKDNIADIKTRWQFVPLFAGLSHHYYNHLAGHSPSLTGVVDLILNQDGATIDETLQPLNFYYVGIHKWGAGIVNMLLERIAKGVKVRRMLIDVKHMSPQARVDYYKILDARVAQDPSDHIPIIKSHSAVSGRRNLQRSIDNSYEIFADEKESCKFFYDGIVNLFDDEIVRIVNSDGLIGLMIDERRIMGKVLPPEAGFKKKSDFNKIAKDSRKALNTIVRCKHKITRLLRDLRNDPTNQDMQRDIRDLQKQMQDAEKVKEASIPKLKPAYMSVFFRQIFHMLDLTGKKGWDHLCLGTDYDGVINPIDIYAQCSDIANIQDDLDGFWNKMLQHTDNSIKSLYQRHLHGQSTIFWIRKLLLLNGMNFLKKYFNDDYLKDKKIPSAGWSLTPAEEATLLALKP